MVRFLAGAAVSFLLLTGAFLLWQSRADQASELPPAPAARLATPAMNLAPIPQAPSADPKNKEQKRFDRADKNKGVTMVLAELVEPRRKPFAKLDLNRDGRLSFEEWAVKTIDKFKTADGNRNGGLTRAEYATTAPNSKAQKPRCDCD
jgi:hypothetical protein